MYCSSRCCGLALSHRLVLYIGLTSLHLSALDRIAKEKGTISYYDFDNLGMAQPLFTISVSRQP